AARSLSATLRQHQPPCQEPWANTKFRGRFSSCIEVIFSEVPARYAVSDHVTTRVRRFYVTIRLSRIAQERRMLHSLPLLRLARTACFTAVALTASAIQAQERPSLDVPYIKTPEAVVDRMLELGEVGPDDYLIDLGSGDGRIPIAAAVKHGTRGLGVDLDPERTKEARELADAAGVSDRLEFRTENLFDTDLSKATVISMYLFPEINLRLRPLLQKLKPGTRIVS